MDNIVKDIVNMGIGTVEKLRTVVEENTRQLQGVFNELKAKGENDSSETALQLRDSINQALENVDQLRGQVDEFVKEQQGRLNQTLDQVREALPDLPIEDLRSKVDELSENIRRNFPGLELVDPEKENEAAESAEATPATETSGSAPAAESAEATPATETSGSAPAAKKKAKPAAKKSASGGPKNNTPAPE